MSTTHPIKTNTKPNQAPPKTSALERFNLGFEYDQTLQDIKRNIRQRTI